MDEKMIYVSVPAITIEAAYEALLFGVYDSYQKGERPDFLAVSAIYELAEERTRLGLDPHRRADCFAGSDARDPVLATSEDFALPPDLVKLALAHAMTELREAGIADCYPWESQAPKDAA